MTASIAAGQSLLLVSVMTASTVVTPMRFTGQGCSARPPILSHPQLWLNCRYACRFMTCEDNHHTFCQIVYRPSPTASRYKPPCCCSVSYSNLFSSHQAILHHQCQTRNVHLWYVAALLSHCLLFLMIFTS
jgi:hypothetical protein